MIVYKELSSLTEDLGFSEKTLYAVSNTIKRHYHKVKIPKETGIILCLDKIVYYHFIVPWSWHAACSGKEPY